MDLTTKEKVKSLLKITDSTNDVVIADIVKGVSAACIKHLGRQVESKERTQYFDVEPGQQVFNLDGYPVTACAVYNDLTRAFATALSSTVYTFLGDSGELIIDQYNLEAGAKVLKVVSTGGLAESQATLETSYPDIELACRMQCAFEFEKRMKLSIASESVGGQTVSQQEKYQLLTGVKEKLNHYRRVLYV